MTIEPISLFISYSHKDESFRLELEPFLKPLRGKLITDWHDRKIPAGGIWDSEIKSQLENADIIIMLVSQDFIASAYISDTEIPIALRRHTNDEAILIPVIVKDFDPYGYKLNEIQSIPRDFRPIEAIETRNSVYKTVVSEIRQVAERIFERRQRMYEKQKDAEEDYRREVAEALADEVISPLERETLYETMKRLGLNEDIARKIEAGEMQPIEEKRLNIKRYERSIEKAIEEYGYPFNEFALDDLTKRQSKLGLQDKDVRGLIDEVAAKFHQRQQDQPLSPEPSGETQMQKEIKFMPEDNLSNLLIFCTRCGTRNISRSNFCQACGHCLVM